MPILQLKSVARSRSRALKGWGIHTYSTDGDEIDLSSKAGIHLSIVEILNNKTGESLDAGDTLTTGTCYVLCTQGVGIKQVSGKHPILLPKISEGVEDAAKHLYHPAFLTVGFLGSLEVKFTPSEATQAEDLLGVEVATLIVMT